MPSNKIKKFINNYDALVRTLHENYPVECKAVMNAWTVEPQKKQVAKQWWADVEEYYGQIMAKDEIIFLRHIPCFERLRLPEVWIKRSLDFESRNYIWLYLQNLTEFSREALNIMKPTTTTTRSQATTPEAMPDLSEMMSKVSSMMPMMMANAQKIAKRYEAKTGHSDQPIDFAQIQASMTEALQGPEGKTMFEEMKKLA